MNRLLSILASLALAFSILVVRANPLMTTPALTPSMSNHFDRIMATFNEANSNMFSNCVDLGLLDRAEEETVDELTLLKSSMVDYAKSFIGRRYKSGGKGPKVFDCSGFTSFVFRNFGFQLMGASRSQSTQGEKVSLQDAQVGDLIFFSGRGGGKTVGHVGMVIEVDDNGTVKFIHASTSQGVVIQDYPDGGYYSRRFLHVRRIIS